MYSYLIKRKDEAFVIHKAEFHAYATVRRICIYVYEYVYIYIHIRNFPYHSSIFTRLLTSINRDRMIEILVAYEIPLSVVNAIRVIYKDTATVVITPEGETNAFNIGTGVLQGDPLAPFLFIIVLDYALRISIFQ